MPEGVLGSEQSERPRPRRHRQGACACSTPPARSTSAKPWSWPTSACSRSRRRKAPTRCSHASRSLRRSGRIAAASRRGVLVKAAKRGQDRRIDLPSIGPRTVEGAVAGRACRHCRRRRQHDRRRARAHRPRRRIARRLFVLGVRDETPIDDSRTGPASLRHSRCLPRGRRGIRRSARRRTDAGAAGAHRRAMRFTGVGGREMAAEGVASLYSDRRSLHHRVHRHPAADSENHPSLMRLHRPRRCWQGIRTSSSSSTVRDSPCGIARRVRAADPTIPIVEYVSPSVWAWRPGRARAMRAYIDHILALLPFEPEVHRRLGGPPCTYVGHPLARGGAANLRPDAVGGAPPARRAAGPAGTAGKQAGRDQAAAWRVCRRPWRWSGIGSDRSRSWCRPSRIWSIRSSRRPRNGRCGRGSWSRRCRQAGGVPDRPGGARQIRHRYARACARRRADGRGLSGVLARGVWWDGE